MSTNEKEIVPLIERLRSYLPFYNLVSFCFQTLSVDDIGPPYLVLTKASAGIISTRVRLLPSHDPSS